MKLFIGKNTYVLLCYSWYLSLAGCAKRHSEWAGAGWAFETCWLILILAASSWMTIRGGHARNFLDRRQAETIESYFGSPSAGLRPRPPGLGHLVWRPSWFLTPTHWSCMLLATSPPLTSVAAHSTFHTHITLNVLSDWNHLLFNFCESLPIPQEPAWISLPVWSPKTPCSHPYTLIKSDCYLPWALKAHWLFLSQTEHLQEVLTEFGIYYLKMWYLAYRIPELKE